MKFRYARHTNDLLTIEQFYTEIVGLERLGSFEDHDGYDGLFLGIKGELWHLEFTISSEKSNSTSDEDDELVFYLSSKEIDDLRKRLSKRGIETLKPKNPYWEKNGVMILDPDGHRVIFTLRVV